MNFVQIRSFKTHCKFLEWSCHGVVWLAGLIAFTYMFDNKDLYQMQVNLFAALIFDIFVVAIIKGELRALKLNRQSTSLNHFSFSDCPPSKTISKRWSILHRSGCLFIPQWPCLPKLNVAGILHLPLSAFSLLLATSCCLVVCHCSFKVS